MVFAIAEEDYIRFNNEPGSEGVFLDCAYIGRTFREVVDAIKRDIMDWHNNTGEIEEPQVWYLFDNDVTPPGKVLFECKPSISVNWSIVGR